MVSHGSDPLAQLRDIHLPALIGWWPIAVGWIGLFFIIIVFSLLILFYSRRYYQRGRARSLGLRLLMQYEKDYQQGASSQIISTQISEILRRVALVYFPREEIAGLQGELWLNFLNKTGKGVNFNEVRECLLVLPYQPDRPAKLDRLFLCAKKWIKQRSGRCLN
ncbi:MAG: hypothetical protein A3F46_03470 [Legionellales bacterium RIFCSPHIGHO2_12_FULL_42_9]|nr:MAG: hypothetical protein A3F46_03470 [Legionellales bacterium RIFCSPHIGHO2_12_FULL_42_9]